MPVFHPIPSNPRFKSLLGNRFSRLTVIGYGGHTKDQHVRPLWHCKCDCGNIITCRGASLRCGDTKSCGCWKHDTLVERLTVHGCASDGNATQEYKVWTGIKARCCNPKSAAFDRYGGRGVAMCDKWLHSFQSFLDDVGPKPSHLHTIDRINKTGNYEPGNVRWATRKEQANNRETNVTITFDGQTRTLAQWADWIGIHPSTLRFRLRNWTISKALTAKS